jgi:hypothetical protein
MNRPETIEETAELARPDWGGYFGATQRQSDAVPEDYR